MTQTENNSKKIKNFVRTFNGSDHTEFYGTIRTSAIRSMDEVRDAYRTFATAIRETKCVPIFEKNFIPLFKKEELRRVRAQVLTEGGIETPPLVTFIDGAPPGDSLLGGIQWWGIRPHGDASKPERIDAQTMVWSNRHFHMCYIASIHADSGENPTLQTESSFQAARLRLENLGFKFKDVLRTWVYLKDILDWYNDFNIVRNKLYATRDFLASANSIPPASTGIGAQGGKGHIFLDVLAAKPIEGHPACFRLIQKSIGQGPAVEYGSNFSRAASLSFDKRTTLYISGTAAIDGAGKTEMPGKPREQLNRTVAHLEEILKEQGGQLADIASAVLYCRTEEALEAALSEISALGLDHVPMIHVIADVCRPDLEVEIEAIAIFNTPMENNPHTTKKHDASC